MAKKERISVAGKRRRKDRQSILVSTTQDFVRNSRPSIQEISRYKELFYPLCLKSNPKERSQVSNLLSHYPYTPRSIVLFFAIDEISVAAPCLLYSDVLNERDIVEISQKKMPEHHLALAQREALTLTSVNALLSADDEEHSLLQQLLANPHLKDNSQIQSALVSANRIQQAPKTTKRDQLADNVVAHEFNTDMQGTDLSDVLLSIASTGGRLGKQQMQQRYYREIQNDNAAQLLRNARAFNHDAFAYCIQRICGIATETTLDAIERQDTGYLAVLLKANGLDRIQASKILLILTPSLGRDAQVLRMVMTKFEEMSLQGCKAFLEKNGANFNIGKEFLTRLSQTDDTIEEYTFPRPADVARERAKANASISGTLAQAG